MFKDNITIADFGRLVLISRAASNPFMTRIVTFKTTTSGFNLRASLIASAPSSASPTTSKRGSCSSVDRTVFLIPGWSSAIRILTGRSICFTLTPVGESIVKNRPKSGKTKIQYTGYLVAPNTRGFVPDAGLQISDLILIQELLGRWKKLEPKDRYTVSM